MRNILFVILVCSFLLVFTACGRLTRPAYINDMTDYIDSNIKGNEKLGDIFLYGEDQEQKCVLIKYYNVDNADEANEIIYLINSYLHDNLGSELNNYYIEVEMSTLKYVYSLNYRVSNSKEYHDVGDVHVRMPIEDELCRLEITGTSEPSDQFKISCVKDRFTGMKKILFGRRVTLDDISALSSHSVLEEVFIDTDGRPYSDSEIRSLSESYPHISFQFD